MTRQLSKILPMLPRRIIFQKWMGQIFFIPIGGPVILLIKYLLNGDIPELKELRAYYKEIRKDPTPLIICANHLTYIDSVIIIYAFGNHWWYSFNFKQLPWNLPAMEYKKNPFFRLICYVSKCIFIDRTGSKEHHQEILQISKTLLRQGEAFIIFPEGRRSKTGKFDARKPAYSIGRIITEIQDCRVLCIYLRSETQAAKSNFPPRKSRFVFKSEMLKFTPENLEGETITSVTEKIAGRIQLLEKSYLDQVGTPAPKTQQS